MDEHPHLALIIDAVKNICDNNASILIRGGECERSCQFVIAHYLANKLSMENRFIDCEFGRNKTLAKFVPLSIKRQGKVFIEGRIVVPDIIYHDRAEKNIFAIELKIKNVDSNRQKNI